MAQLQKGTTYATGTQVTANNLNTHVDGAILLHGAINEQVSGTVFSSDNVLLAGTSSLKKATIAQVQAGLVKSDGTVAMTNHLQLASSSPPNALTAASKGYVDAIVSTTVANAIAGIISVPVGCIMAWPSAFPPSGWIECNGQAAPTYALQVIVGNNVPDLRDRFIRGWNHARGVNSFQDDAIQNITGNITLGNNGIPNSGADGVFTATGSTSQAAFGGGSVPKVWNFDASRVVRTADETRPKNIALMYIIKT